MAAGATGGQIVARTLRRLGVEVIFSVSGNQILPIYDAAADAGLRIIHMRHESAAAYAAAVYAERTGQPGVALTSAGPGFIAGLTGVAVAQSMELPMLYLSGAAPLAQRGMGAFQDVAQHRIAGSVCKATLEPPSVERVAATIARGWRTARSGIPGPVHVALPADVLLATSATRLRRPIREESNGAAMTRAERAVLDTIADRLQEARRPLVIARPAATRGKAGQALRRLCKHLGITPLVTESPRGLSDQKYTSIIQQAHRCDVALVVAPADFAVGFLSSTTLPAASSLLLIDAPGDPRPKRTPDARSQASPADALNYLLDALNGAKVSTDPLWATRLTVDPAPAAPLDDEPDGIHPLAVSDALREVLAPDDIVVLDGGEFCQWVRLGLRDIANPLYWNGKLGAIGGGIPMAIGAAIAQRAGRVFVVLGDGSAGYHLSEYETAARYGIPLVGIIGNDARWAAEWHMQRSRYGPERAFETLLLPARYDIAARGFGASGLLIEDRTALYRALAEARAIDDPLCLNVRVAALRSPAEVKH
ncbi:MAG: hypothetical protein DCC58_02880 [Chloroflexi bacterium]|nr:MAG: hypothetical protein DCC58_02880 [Chloroflexota bacterium]